MQIDPALRMLGLAAKAGKVASGEFMTENSVKTGMAALVIVATDASDNTKKKFRNMCEFYEVPMYEFWHQRCIMTFDRKRISSIFGS